MYKTREELLAMTNEERIACFNKLLELFQQLPTNHAFLVAVLGSSFNLNLTQYRPIIANEIVECFNTIDFEPLPKEVEEQLNKRLSFITCYKEDEV